MPTDCTVTRDYSASNKIRVLFSAIDLMSAIYTSQNTSSGLNGIKSYVATLKQGTTTIATGSVDPTKQALAYLFSSLPSNTTYSCTVTATDLAGNLTTSNAIQVTTLLSAPAGLKLQDSSYCTLNFKWNVLPGATSYFVWADSTNPISVTTTSYTFAGLKSGRKYHLNVRGVNAAGNGDIASKYFSTLSYPKPSFTAITSPMCGTSQTITVSPVRLATSYTWTVTSPLNINGSQTATTPGNSVTVTSTGVPGSSTITVKANTSCGSTPTSNTTIWAGIPVLSAGIVDGNPYTSGYQICPGNHWLKATPGSASGQISWTVPSGIPYFVGNNELDFTFPSNASGISISAKASNSCGTSTNFNFYLVKKTYGCSSSNITLSPNPASDYVNVTLNIDPILVNYTDTTSNQEVINSVTNPTQSFTINMLNSQGVKVLTLLENEPIFIIPLNSFSNGTYLIVVGDGKNTYNQQLIIKH